jgi:hypothetical protein
MAECSRSFGQIKNNAGALVSADKAADRQRWEAERKTGRKKAGGRNDVGGVAVKEGRCGAENQRVSLSRRVVFMIRKSH